MLDDWVGQRMTGLAAVVCETVNSCPITSQPKGSKVRVGDAGTTCPLSPLDQSPSRAACIEFFP
jgi:hypothetical protein